MCKVKIIVDKHKNIMYNEYKKKARPQTVMPLTILFYNSRLAGGYCTFMVKIIKTIIISNIAKSNFFAICTILIFISTPPFIDSGI